MSDASLDDTIAREFIALAAEERAQRMPLTHAYIGSLGATRPTPGAPTAEGQAVDPIPESWLPIDLGPMLDGGHEPPVPDLLRTKDGTDAFFYRANVNGVHGDSGTGKSWLTLAAIAQVLGAGRRAVLIDYEANGDELVSRLRALGATRAQIDEQLVYLNPNDPITPPIVAHVLGLLTGDTDLVVIDSLGEAFGLDGINEDKDSEVAPWLRGVARPLANAGPAVVIVDHATKAADNPLHPSGSKRKRAAITGASYQVTSPKPPTRTDPGTLRLTCAKDRHGNYRRGEVVATVDVTPYPDGGVSVNVHRLTATAPDSPGIGIEVIARRMVELVRGEAQAMSANAICERVEAKARTTTKKAALEYAVSKGALEVTPGARRSLLHSYVRDLPEPGS